MVKRRPKKLQVSLFRAVVSSDAKPRRDLNKPVQATAHDAVDPTNPHLLFGIAQGTRFPDMNDSDERGSYQRCSIMQDIPLPSNIKKEAEAQCDSLFMLPCE
ncbi:MAG: hypothetical protein ACYC7D_09390 [Nitrososphaerales archaeon]